MRKKISLRLLGIIPLLVLALMLSSCGVQQSATREISPIEPVVPGLENGGAYAVKGRFSVRSGNVQIQALSVTTDGSLAVVGTSSRSLYLLGEGGSLVWEKNLTSDFSQAVIDPEGRYLAVGTVGGKLLVIKPDQPQAAEEYYFDAPVAILAISLDGERILVGLAPEDQLADDALLLLDRQGNKLWRKNFPELLDAKIVGDDNLIFVNWQEGGESAISAYSALGENLWELQQREQMAVDGSGKMLVSVHGNEVRRYSQTAAALGSYSITGTVNRVIMAEAGAFFGVLATDEATRNQDLLYFDADGNKLWSKRLPNGSDVLLSADGLRIIVASWRQYRDDATQVVIYNQWGQQINLLDVAGRAQKMALADRGDTLVLGLEEGSIYFLNIAEVINRQLNETGQRGLLQYYTPVSFEIPAGESMFTLFFYDSKTERMIPVTRRIKRPQSVLRASIEELVRGPLQGSHLNRTIPKNVEIQVSQSNGIVQLNLPASLDEMSGSTFLSGILDSLLLTVSQFPTVRQIQFTVNGERRAAFGQEGLNIGEAFTPARFGHRPGERLVFLPSRSESRYYLRPESVSGVALQGEALIENLVRYVLTQSSQLYSLNLAAVRIENEIVYLDFTDSFHNLLADNMAAAARAALLRDALALTILENAPYANIHLTVNGKTPVQPEHFLPWESTVSRPYFLNLEE
ncbi:MAG: GerMN domain-containing protein [Dethiobacter sp.]|jgi:germination protein M|nr:GerMN domain-containing protein [Dethiobacter sp.]MBS3901761.1 GerMN domain-containing protein [Dethiobacter sp.]MBS3988364.1 GerMN domain-containing protein [Dethiobacter sp.]